MFEADADQEIVSEINEAFARDDDDAAAPHSAHQNEAPDEDGEGIPEWWLMEGYGRADADRLRRNRQRLDAGKGAELFDKFRAAEDKWNGSYRVLVLAALTMACGARIRYRDLRRIHEILLTIVWRPGCAWPLADYGFRLPGLVQFCAALGNYSPGTPRSFHEPRSVLDGLARVPG